MSFEEVGHIDTYGSKSGKLQYTKKRTRSEAEKTDNNISPAFLDDETGTLFCDICESMWMGG